MRVSLSIEHRLSDVLAQCEVLLKLLRHMWTDRHHDRQAKVRGHFGETRQQAPGLPPISVKILTKEACLSLTFEDNDADTWMVGWCTTRSSSA